MTMSAHAHMTTTQHLITQAVAHLHDALSDLRRIPAPRPSAVHSAIHLAMRAQDELRDELQRIERQAAALERRQRTAQEVVR